MVDATSAYVTQLHGGTLKKVALDGSTETTIASGQSIGSFAVDSASVYWTTLEGAVMKLTPK